jgi:hypothetical protein
MWPYPEIFYHRKHLFSILRNQQGARTKYTRDELRHWRRRERERERETDTCLTGFSLIRRISSESHLLCWHYRFFFYPKVWQRKCLTLQRQINDMGIYGKFHRTESLLQPSTFITLPENRIIIEIAFFAGLFRHCLTYYIHHRITHWIPCFAPWCNTGNSMEQHNSTVLIWWRLYWSSLLP